MSGMETSLPAGFAALEPFVAEWAIEGSAARAARRDDSTPQERETFYAAARDLVKPALDYLDSRGGLHGLDAADWRLMNLVLAMSHVSLAVEMQKDAESGHAVLRRFLPITRTPAGA